MALVSTAELLARYNYFDTFSSTNVADDLLYYAEVEVNARLASHFDVPMVGHPTVKDLIIDLAYFRGLRVKDPDKADKIRQDVIGRIDEIKQGNEFIVTGSGTTLEPAAGIDTIWSSTMDYHPVHSMLDAEDSVVDSSMIADLNTERGYL